MKRAAAFALLLASAAPVAYAEPKPSKLLRAAGDAEVDWEAGKVTLRAGAPADLRMPGPEAARPAAKREAEKRGILRLAEALRTINLEGGRKLGAAEATTAAAHAVSRDVDYQSNGGVLLTLELDIAELGAADRGPQPAPKKISAAPGAHVDTERATPSEPYQISLAVGSMPLEATPVIFSGGVERTLGRAVYRLGEAPKARTGSKPDDDDPADGRVHPAKRDRRGRLVVALPPQVLRKLEGAHATIYLRSVAAGKK